MNRPTPTRDRAAQYLIAEAAAGRVQRQHVEAFLGAASLPVAAMVC